MGVATLGMIRKSEAPVCRNELHSIRWNPSYPMNKHHMVLVSHAAGGLGAPAPKPNGSVTRFEIEA